MESIEERNLRSVPLRRFEDQVVVVTGAAQGIGKKIAECFFQEGAKVFLMDLDSSLVNKTARELSDDPNRVAAACADVSKRSDVSSALHKCLDQFGRLDIMIAHAGIAMADHLLQIDDESWNKVLDVNLNGVFYCVQEAGRIMAKRGGGQMVVTTSTNSFWVESNLSHYNTSKGAVLTFIRSAAMDLAPYGIRVNGVAPGVVNTRISKWVIENPQLSEMYLKMIPLKRFGEPEDIAKAVLFLSSTDSSYITGQTLIVDGGQTLGISVEEPTDPIPGV